MQRSTPATLTPLIIVPPFPSTSSAETSPLDASISFPIHTFAASPPPSPRSLATKFFSKSRSRLQSTHPSPSPLSIPRPDTANPLLLAGERSPSTPLLYGESRPRIKSCSVPHHSKLGAKGIFACRVVPESDIIARASGSSMAVPVIKKKASLGKMDMAGTGDSSEQNEPFTVWRRYEEFADLSAKCVQISLEGISRTRSDSSLAR